MSLDKDATNSQDQSQSVNPVELHAQNASPLPSGQQQYKAPSFTSSNAVDEESNGGNGDGQKNQASMYSSVESDLENWDAPSPPVWQSLQSLARQLSPVLVPLPFAILTFLFTLVAYAHNSAHLAPLPLGIILFALVILQAISLYYASSNDTLWTLYTIGGYVLFLLVAAYAIFGFVGSLILFIIFLLLAIVLGRRAVYLVPEGKVYIVMKFGKYSRTLFPGLNLLFPWEKVSQYLSTREVLWTSPPQRIQLSQETDVELRATFSYQLLPEDAYVAALGLENNWQESIENAFISAIHSIPTFSPAIFMAIPQSLHNLAANKGSDIQTSWDQMNTQLYQVMQNVTAPWGVLINWVNIRDVQLLPHVAGLAEQPLTPIEVLLPKASQEGSLFARLGDTSATISADLLNFHQYAQSIVHNLIADVSKGFDQNSQLTIGIYGEWGSGKTSFLHMIEYYLANDFGNHAIWFDAWKYDKEDNLWAALIQRILDQATENGKWYRRARVKFRIWIDGIRWHAGTWEVIKKVTPVILKIFFICAGLYILIGLDSKTIESFLHQWLPSNSIFTSSVQANILKVIGALSAAVAAVSGPFSLIGLFKGNLGIDFSKFREKPSYQEHIAFLDKFSDEFGRIIQQLGRGKPLVVMIDDLDRCLPEKVIQIIEATKLILDIKGCVFILALDRDIVEKAVASKYKDIMSANASSDVLLRKKPVFYEDYIDKFIQLPIVLPRLTRPNLKNFISLLSEDPDIKTCADIFSMGLSPNPRKIKRVLRSFVFVRDMVVRQQQHVEIRILAKLAVIQNEMPHLYDDVIDDPEILGNLEGFYLTRNDDAAPEKEKYQHYRERAKNYESMYPQFPGLLHTSVSESDSFLKVDSHRYLKYLGVVQPQILQNKVDEERLVPPWERHLAN